MTNLFLTKGLGWNSFFYWVTILLFSLLYLSLSSCSPCFTIKNLNGTWLINPEDDYFTNYYHFESGKMDSFTPKLRVHELYRPAFSQASIVGCDTLGFYSIGEFQVIGKVLEISPDTLKLVILPSERQEYWVKVEDF